MSELSPEISGPESIGEYVVARTIDVDKIETDAELITVHVGHGVYEVYDGATRELIKAAEAEEMS